MELNTTLTTAIEQTSEQVERYGDGPVYGGKYRLNILNIVYLQVAEVNGEVLKWSVLYDAVKELLDWMTSTMQWESVQFGVYYGFDQVGNGSVELVAEVSP